MHDSRKFAGFTLGSPGIPWPPLGSPGIHRPPPISDTHSKLLLTSFRLPACIYLGVAWLSNSFNLECMHTYTWSSDCVRAHPTAYPCSLIGQARNETVSTRKKVDPNVKYFVAEEGCGEVGKGTKVKLLFCKKKLSNVFRYFKINVWHALWKFEWVCILVRHTSVFPT